MSSIYDEYIQLTKTYQAKYGEKTIVLLQVGAFFEIYGFSCPRSGEWIDSQITSVAQICNLNISEKKATHEGRQVAMAGFRDYTLDKYLQRCTEDGYTAVVYIQVKEGKMIKRVLDSVHSAGTYMSYDTDTAPSQITNNSMALWIDHHNNLSKKTETVVFGIAVANLFTGTSNIMEYHNVLQHKSDRKIQPIMVDEIERMVSIHHPSEVIIVSNLSKEELQLLVQYAGFSTHATFHYVDKKVDEKVHHCQQQKYIHHILDKLYGQNTKNMCSEFDQYPTATQAFCFLMDFVQEHNPNLVKHIGIPRFQETTHVLLANHTLKQLNILDVDSTHRKQHGHISSVSSLLNKCMTAMGRRQFHLQLVSPTTDIPWLNKQYANTETVLSNYESLVPPIRQWLSKIHDIEKFARQLMLQKVYPCSMFSFYQSIHNTVEIYTVLQTADPSANLVAEQPTIERSTNVLREFLDKKLHLDVCKTTATFGNIESNFIKRGINATLDELEDSYQENIRLFHAVHTWLNQLIRDQESTPSTTETEYVKIHETEKSGVSLQITKKRGALLKKCLQPNETYEIPNTPLKIEGKDVKFVSASGSNDEIVIPILSKICHDMCQQKEDRNRQMIQAFYAILTSFETACFADIEMMIRYITNVDVLINKAFIAKQYHYCCPTIASADEDDNVPSFVSAKGLRHALIEHIQTREFYVSNDIDLGQHTKGVLLYGTNAVGKTSLIRALGIAVIMAQAGLHVSCSDFQYKPYTSIFSRILGQDNLFKGLSTFAVEMCELRVILKMANQGSLVLGDELCSGTETESALSIFVSGLMDLHQKNVSFIFATHFHEIVNYSEIQDLEHLELMHMAVHYDRETDQLIYDRKLQSGPGNRMYGLEVCKSLHLPELFLNQAYLIRRKYWPETKGSLSNTTSRYNSQKIRGLCELCGKHMGEEIHHILPQADADEEGMVRMNPFTSDTVHKNHHANLMSLCAQCHRKHHASEPKSV
jgi:DNA mismatch repair protein MutS